ncbi:AraC family transcriptional regulator [Actinoplanes couchii]|uniref:AraC family transcriptional regulator n=1 Tax=Actinoplanes couchii TaxID=403638 RepID=A0ABQ3XTY8_9ACTN|nr:AraC family transcriptional regulator [Actinoplanes couchii]MDR6319001.1 AraC-like DNA-binding protein [Actinoplanes couchii]GID61973.1 AraC family transcriptional regulator [Actinoplanes couchii]
MPDPLTITAILAGVDVLSELRDLIPRLHGTVARGSWLPGSLVSAATSESEPYCAHLEPMVAVVVAGEKRTALAGHEFRYGAGEYLIFSMELAVTARITRADPFLAAAVRLRPELVAELLLEAPSDHTSGPVAGVAAADDELLDAFRRLLRLVERPRDFAVLAPGIEREIHWRLLTGPLGALVRQVGRADERFTLARRAARWLENHYDRTIRIEDLARHTGVSVATLNRHFRAATTMSPVQYQKQLRLQEARVRLTAAPGDVAGVGHAVGYESLSQFSREYRRLFGVTPTEDIRRVRTRPPAPES